MLILICGLLHIEVTTDRLWDVLRAVAETIRQPGWYFHLVGEGRIYVVMPHAIFFADGADDIAFDSIIAYGMKQCGIHPEQLEIKGLLANPYG